MSEIFTSAANGMFHFKLEVSKHRPGYFTAKQKFLQGKQFTFELFTSGADLQPRVSAKQF